MESIVSCVHNRQASGLVVAQYNKYSYCAISLNSVLNGTPTFIGALLILRERLTAWIVRHWRRIIGEELRHSWEDCEDGKSCLQWKWERCNRWVGRVWLIWELRKATEYGNTGIRWKFSSFLEDLDFADDLPLISSRREHIQTKVNNLGRYAKMTGLTISTTWCIWDGTTSKPKRFKLIEKNWKRWWNLFI